MDLEGLITPTDLHYTVQHFAVPPVVPTDQWELKIHGQVKNELTLNFDQLRRFPGRSVRTVMECSGSDATFFEYFKDEASAAQGKGMALGSLECGGATVFLKDANGAKRRFTVQSSSCGIKLRASSSSDFQRWHDALSRVASTEVGGSPESCHTQEDDEFADDMTDESSCPASPSPGRSQRTRMSCSWMSLSVLWTRKPVCACTSC